MNEVLRYWTGEDRAAMADFGLFEGKDFYFYFFKEFRSAFCGSRDCAFKNGSIATAGPLEHNFFPFFFCFVAEKCLIFDYLFISRWRNATGPLTL